MWTPQVDLRVAAKGATQLPHQCDNPLQANISNVGDYTMMAVSIDAFRLQRLYNPRARERRQSMSVVALIPLLPVCMSHTHPVSKCTSQSAHV